MRAKSIGDPKMFRIALVLGLVAFCAAKKHISHCCSAEDRHIVQKQWQNLFDYMSHSSKLKIQFAEILLLRYTIHCAVFLPPHAMRSEGYYVFTMCPVVCAVVPMSHDMSACLFHFARILNLIRWNLRKVSLPLTDELIIFWAKLYQGQGSRIRQKIRIDVKRCCHEYLTWLEPRAVCSYRAKLSYSVLLIFYASAEHSLQRRNTVFIHHVPLFRPTSSTRPQGG